MHTSKPRCCTARSLPVPPRRRLMEPTPTGSSRTLRYFVVSSVWTVSPPPPRAVPHWATTGRFLSPARRCRAGKRSRASVLPALDDEAHLVAIVAGFDVKLQLMKVIDHTGREEHFGTIALDHGVAVGWGRCNGQSQPLCPGSLALRRDPQACAFGHLILGYE